MADQDNQIDVVPDDEPDAQPDGVTSDDARTDQRSDIEQSVEARSDAVARGEGGSEPIRFTNPGEFDGNSGTGGEVKNQDLDQQ